MSKKIGVVILNWNGRTVLEQYLPSVVCHSQQEGTVIYVVDNGSTDDSVSWIKSNYPTEIELIVFKENHGYAGGYNKALKQLDCEYVMLLNSDVEVTPYWLDPLFEYMENNPEVVACQPKIKNWRERSFFEYAGAAGGFLDCYGYPFCRGRIFSTLEKDVGQYNTPVSIFWATGAALFIRLKDFLRVGGFDEHFFAHMEEIDLCWRLLARGGKIMCVPESEVYHYGGATLDNENPRKLYLNFRNNLLMLYKNLPEKELTKIMCVRWFLDYFASFKFLLSGSLLKMKAVWKARKDFQAIKMQFLPNRMENLEKTVQENINEQKKYSILVKYYIERKRKFSELNKN
ncbi:MAG: glycosyltransferase family 2 protein [Bacteroidales bacterium]|nr:glycosyltransferase family 2 protein [Bacteroidales bacterium]